jgi:hypothetical protein
LATTNTLCSPPGLQLNPLFQYIKIIKQDNICGSLQPLSLDCIRHKPQFIPQPECAHWAPVSPLPIADREAVFIPAAGAHHVRELDEFVHPLEIHRR